MSAPAREHLSLRSLETALHTLHLPGAAAIASFGWAVCDLLGWQAAPWLGLWSAGALLVYNIDRLRRDPADGINTPQRERASLRLRFPAGLIAALSAGMLVAWPVLKRDWLTLSLVLAGGTVCLGYSIPLFGRRLKAVPVLKSIFAPAIVAAAVFGLPALHEGWRAPPLEVALAAAWACGFLQWNMLLCDLRDCEGDRRTGVRSVPVLLGEKRTRGLLIALGGCTALPALLLAAGGSPEHRRTWAFVAAAGALASAALLRAVRTAQPERFYERWAEGYLFLPALAAATEHL